MSMTEQTTLPGHARFRRLLRGVRFLNPDQLALEKLCATGRQGFHDATAEELQRCFIKAAETVERELREALAQGQVIGVERVLHTSKYCPLVEHALADEAFFGLSYVALNANRENATLTSGRTTGTARRPGFEVPAFRRFQWPLHLLSSTSRRTRRSRPQAPAAIGPGPGRSDARAASSGQACRKRSRRRHEFPPHRRAARPRTIRSGHSAGLPNRATSPRSAAPRRSSWA